LATILNFRLKLASNKVVWCASETYMPENDGVSAGIWFLSGIELEKPWGRFTPPPGWLQTFVKLGGYTKVKSLRTRVFYVRFQLHF